MAHWIDPIESTLNRYGVKPIDHLLILHSGYEDDGPLTVEAVAPMDERDIPALVARSEGRFIRRELPAVPRMATTLHQGHPSYVLPAYRSLGNWIESNAYTIVGPRRKIRLRRSASLDDALTEVQFPVERAA